MTGRVRRRLVASALVAALGTACGGGGPNKDVHPSAAEPRRSPSARPESTATATTVSSVHERYLASVPPELIDRGEDHLRIARSLLEYGRWLDSDDPDPALVTRAYAAGGSLARVVTDEVTRLRRERQRKIEVDRAPLDFFVLSDRRDVVSYRVVEHLLRRVLIDAHGRTLHYVGAATETYVVVMIRYRPDGPWRVLSVREADPPIEVQL